MVRVEAQLAVSSGDPGALVTISFSDGVSSFFLYSGDRSSPLKLFGVFGVMSDEDDESRECFVLSLYSLLLSVLLARAFLR